MGLPFTSPGDLPDPGIKPGSLALEADALTSEPHGKTLPRSVSALYVTGDQWRNNSRRNEETEPEQKQHPIVDVTGDRSKV